MKKIPEGRRGWFIEMSSQATTPLRLVGDGCFVGRHGFALGTAVVKACLIFLADEFYQLTPCPFLANWCRRQKSTGYVFR